MGLDNPDIVAGDVLDMLFSEANKSAYPFNYILKCTHLHVTCL